MKKKELKQMATKSLSELRKALEKKRSELIKVRPEVKVGKEKNLKKAKNLRREIAQIITLIRQKELVEKIKKESETKKKEVKK